MTAILLSILWMPQDSVPALSSVCVLCPCWSVQSQGITEHHTPIPLCFSPALSQSLSLPKSRLIHVAAYIPSSGCLEDVSNSIFSNLSSCLTPFYVLPAYFIRSFCISGDDKPFLQVVLPADLSRRNTSEGSLLRGPPYTHITFLRTRVIQSFDLVEQDHHIRKHTLHLKPAVAS